jgi:hypothetical protein
VDPERDDEFVDRLDFSNVRLTRERIRRIPYESFPQVESVTFGEVDSAATAVELLHRCGPLRELDARRVPLTARDLSDVSFQEDVDLHVQQGPMSAEDFCALCKRLRPNLWIHAAKITDAELQQIELAGPGCFEVYKHYGDDDADRIYPHYDDGSDPESPFSN